MAKWERSEANEMWRALKGDMVARRDKRERVQEARIARAVAAGEMDCKPLGEYGWRITSPRLVDYWPRTGKWRTPDGKVDGRGWTTLRAFLSGQP